MNISRRACLQIKHTSDGKSPVDVYTRQIAIFKLDQSKLFMDSKSVTSCPCWSCSRSVGWFHCQLKGHTRWIILTNDHLKLNIATPRSYLFCWHKRGPVASVCIHVLHFCFVSSGLVATLSCTLCLGSIFTRCSRTCEWFVVLYLFLPEVCSTFSWWA